jgi:hypothetical protein
MVFDASIGVGALASITRAGQGIARRAVDYVGTEAIDDIVIEFTKESARLEVAVTGTGAVDEPEPVLLVLFSDDPSLWPHGRVQYERASASSPSAAKSATPTPESSITLPPIVPGRYRIIAIHDPEISIPEDTAILEKLRPFATPVTLVAGETPKITIGVAKLVR